MISHSSVIIMGNTMVSQVLALWGNVEGGGLLDVEQPKTTVIIHDDMQNDAVEVFAETNEKNMADLNIKEIICREDQVLY